MEGLAAIPEWVPNGNHLLKSTSTIQKIRFDNNKISFKTFDDHSEVVLRITSKPKIITVSGKPLSQLLQPGDNGYTWEALEKGGVLRLRYENGNEVDIIIK